MIVWFMDFVHYHVLKPHVSETGAISAPGD